MVKILPASAGDVGSIPCSERSPGEGNSDPLQCFLPGKFCEQRRLVGYSPWGLKRVSPDLESKQQEKEMTIVLVL